MTIRHLQILIAVADYGKMSAAAKHLFISQSSVSQVIAELEAEYNTRLFERLSKKLYITDKGRELLRYARRITLLYEEMEEHMREGGGNETLKVGATYTVAASVLSNIIQCFDDCHPNVTAEVVVGRTNDLAQKLIRNELDIALVEGVITLSELYTIPVMDDELFLICNDTHPFYALEAVDIAELQGHPFIVREKGSRTREIFDRFLIERDIQVKEKWICNNSEAIKCAVISGQGLAVISEKWVVQECAKGLLKKLRINGASMKRKFSLVYHKNKFHSEALMKFIEICQDYEQSSRAAAASGSEALSDA